jgi:hypothetical protein
MDEIRFNQPDKQISGEEKPKSKRNIGPLLNKVLKALGIAAIVVAVILIAFLSRNYLGGIFGANKDESYSAVFLSNGQVYFGKITANNEREIVLSNVFYLQINDKAAQANSADTLSQTSFNLIKLGQELHGPTDELFVNRSQVVFYENLRADSKVVESIKNYKQ